MTWGSSAGTSAGRFALSFRVTLTLLMAACAASESGTASTAETQNKATQRLTLRAFSPDAPFNDDVTSYVQFLVKARDRFNPSAAPEHFLECPGTHIYDALTTRDMFTQEAHRAELSDFLASRYRLFIAKNQRGDIVAAATMVPDWAAFDSADIFVQCPDEPIRRPINLAAEFVSGICSAQKGAGTALFRLMLAEAALRHRNLAALHAPAVSAFYDKFEPDCAGEHAALYISPQWRDGALIDTSYEATTFRSVMWLAPPRALPAALRHTPDRVP